MRKASLLIGICMLAAVAIALAAQAPPTDLSPVMKDVAATQNKMRMDMMAGNGADVAADAQKLEQDFTQAMGFFKAMKAQDAVDMAKANVDAAGAVAKAAKANDMDAAKAAAGTIQKSCKACHDVHREGDGKATPYKFK
jgi:Spy/CpxP family protein refolding chaperone